MTGRQLKHGIVIVVVALALLSGCNNDQVADKTTAEHQLYAELIKQYDATSNWRSLFIDDESAGSQGTREVYFWERPYSYKISEVIARQGKQPIFFLAFLSDIVRSDSGYAARFSCYGQFDYDTGGYYGFLTLSCSREQVEYLTEPHGYGDLAMYAIISTIRDFRRPRFSIYNEAFVEENEAWSELHISIVNELEVLYGDLIDVRRL